MNHRRVNISVLLIIFLILPLTIFQHEDFSSKEVKNDSPKTSRSTLLWQYLSSGGKVKVAISSDGSYVAYNQLRVVRLFEKSSSTPLWTRTMGGNINDIAISGNGDYVVVGGVDDRITLMRNSGGEQWSYRNPWMSEIRSVAISSDGEYIAGGTVAGRVFFFHKSSSTPLWNYKTGYFIRSISISAGGDYITAGSWDERVYLFHKSSRIPVWSYYTGDDISYVAISSDGNYITAGNNDGDLYLFHRSSSTPLWSYQMSDFIGDVAISSDGSYIVASDYYDHRVYLFSRSSSTPLWSYRTGDDVSSVAITSNGKFIAAGGDRLYFFQNTRSTPLWAQSTGGKVNSVAISSYGDYITAGNFVSDLYLVHESIAAGPYFINNPNDFSIFEGDIYSTITWTPREDNSNYGSYWIIQDGVRVDEGPWNGENIIFEDLFSLNPGTHSITCYVSNGDGRISSAMVTVTVLLNHVPIVFNNSNHITMTYGSVGYSLSWHALDIDDNIQSYWITRNGMKINEGSLNNDEDIVFIENVVLEEGNYNYSCFVIDKSGAVNQSSIFVEISSNGEDRNNNNGSIPGHNLFLIISIISMITIVLIKKSANKKKFI